MQALNKETITLVVLCHPASRELVTLQNRRRIVIPT